MMPTTNITKNTLTSTPVLKILPITEQLESVRSKVDMNAMINPLVSIRFLRLKTNDFGDINYYTNLIFY